MVMLGGTTWAFASDFEYEGLYYTIISESNNFCRLIEAPGGVKYSGDITVPETVVYEGKSYTVESIADGAFSLSNITNLKIKAKIQSLPRFACHACYELENVELPYVIEKIEDNAFDACENLISINLPNSLKSIGGSAFENCKSLETITLPEGVTFIGWSNFRGCTSLKEVRGYVNCKGINGNRNFMNCIALNNIIVPQVSSDISLQCYSGCTGLVDIDFTSFITSIDQQAFEDCINLKSLTFGENLDHIGDKAFNNCFDIQTITCKVLNPKAINETTFTKTVYENATLIVPWNCVDKYKNCAGWNLFKNIVESTDVVEPRTISFDENQLETFEGKSLMIEAKIAPVNATHFHIEWSAPKELTLGEQNLVGNIASCKVTPAKAGTYVLTVKCISDITGEVLCQNVCVLTVKAQIVPTSMKVELSTPIAELYQRVSLTWTIYPEDYTGDYYVNIGTIFTGIDARAAGFELYSYEELGTVDLSVSLISAETGETILYEPLTMEFVRAGGFFDCGEGVIQILFGEEGLSASIKPNEGYILHSVTMDGNDVTSQFADGAQVPVKSMPTFKIVFEKKEHDAVNELENSLLKVAQHGNVIEITGAKDENSTVTIYDANGRAITRTNNHKITLTTHGVHILVIEGRTFKFKV